MTAFRVGGHDIQLWQEQGRWAVAVDGVVHRHWFMSEARAAGAGLLRAQRLRRIARAVRASGGRAGAPSGAAGDA